MPTYDFSDQVVFVTGAARGQGRSHAQSYAQYGADVVVTDIGHNHESVPYNLGTEDELAETARIVEEEGQRALEVQMDVADEAAVEKAVDQAIAEFGQIDILANNASVWPVADLIEMEEESWDVVLESDLKGVWLCSKHVARHMIDRGEGGKIISTSSSGGLVGYPNLGHYVAAKHGVLGLTKTLALELAEQDINVNAVCPGTVNTPGVDELIETYGEETLEEFGRFSGIGNVLDPDNPVVESQDITEAYLWLSSDAAEYVTGIALPVDGGGTAA